jgi:hypothetical protein
MNKLKLPRKPNPSRNNKRLPRKPKKRKDQNILAK